VCFWSGTGTFCPLCPSWFGLCLYDGGGRAYWEAVIRRCAVGGRDGEWVWITWPSVDPRV